MVNRATTVSLNTVPGFSFLTEMVLKFLSRIYVSVCELVFMAE